jgi:FHA domain
MGRLRHVHSERSCELEPEHVVGRSPGSTLVIEHELVSKQHAVLRWSGTEWTLRDLGSRNGTFVEGARITTAPTPIKEGARVRFGSADSEWQLVDASPPRPLLVSVDDGSSLRIDGEMLALPSPDNPVATVFRDASGAWLLERADGTRPLGIDDSFEVAGRTWCFRSASSLARTTAAALDAPALPRLIFSVSSDEEHVELSADVAGQRVVLGTSPRYYLLLTLARQRAADRGQGMPESSCGWMHHEDLQKALALGQQHLNIDVFRIRRQLAEKGLACAATVIERRPRSRQLRLGWADFEVHRI